MSATCPVCDAPQDLGLMCHSCTSVIERELAEVRALMGELDVTASKQARIGGGGKGGPARERSPIDWGGVEAADVLTNTLTTWARDVAESQGWVWAPRGEVSSAASYVLLRCIDAIRRHPEAFKLFDEITDAIRQARRAIDRAANRTIIFVGPCPELNAMGGHCDGEVHAFIPTEDDRPSRMECRTDKTHQWTAVQWMRTGKRILDRIQERKRETKGAA